MANQESFEYTYSAPEQEEIRMIREKYLPPEQRENKLEQLRRLDAGVTKKGTWTSITLGLISTLVMGFGMSCCLVMTEYFVLGVIVGIIGMIGIALAYPCYVRITNKEKKRVAPRILQLTEELME